MRHFSDCKSENLASLFCNVAGKPKSESESRSLKSRRRFYQKWLQLGSHAITCFEQSKIMIHHHCNKCFNRSRGSPSKLVLGF